MAAPSFLSAKQRASTRQEIAARDGTGTWHAASSTGFTGNITIDTNALDRDGSASDLLIERQLELQLSWKVNIVVPQRVRREARQPNTVLTFAKRSIRNSSPVRQNLQGKSFSCTDGSNFGLQGNAKPAKHISARHLFEAGNYGGGHVVTNDERILDKTSELADLLPPC